MEGARKMLMTKLQNLPTVVLFCCIFLFLLVAKSKWESLETLSSLPDIKLKGGPDSAGDRKSAMVFEWESALERTKETKPSGLLSPPQPVAKRHPLEVVYSTDYKFLLNEPKKCWERSPFLILLVITKPQDFATRQAIRQTWGNESSVPGVSILRLFLTGVHPKFGYPLQALLEEESSIHKDIIQQDFLDTYNNLTLKTLMGMEWISKFCPNATYVVKADSDIFLNVNYMVSQLLQPHLPPKKNYMTGYICRNSKPVRNKAYKWYVPREVYPNETYPPYCAGPGYVFSGDLAKKIYQVAKTIRVINMEDAFMGICLYELGISVTNSPGGLFKTFHVRYEKCKLSQVVVVHPLVVPEELLQIWPGFQDQNQTCKS
ncbi:beta-1,3-galactosyltransferase 1-like [Podarcis raffonei]|uniref:beta-1,3-galactosyltransferase 1-like n=1 Tax=Podarcis raffonei TaxID=65483 RepID=UPI0023296036|nr:beta-1,3-galactosyltransferase 1-like [Podarcis raffonei]